MIQLMSPFLSLNFGNNPINWLLRHGNGQRSEYEPIIQIHIVYHTLALNASCMYPYGFSEGFKVLKYSRKLLISRSYDMC